MSQTEALPRVRLKIARRSQHPWIFQRMVERPPKRIPPGTIVDVEDKEGEWIGRGFYNGHSRISLRILTTDAEESIDAEFFRNRLGRAVSLRREGLELDSISDAYRLVHSEGDGLSGLVVDRFGPVIVLEFFSAGMFKCREMIQEALLEHYPESKFYWFAEGHVQKQESFDCFPPKPPSAPVITENGVRFRVAPGGKHKTGFFLDQRENRRMLASFCKEKRVLDLCCNSGGFAVYAQALGGASEVTGVDLDEEALGLARQNASLNQGRVRFIQADIFSWLRNVRDNGDQFDVVVLDPAKQTRDRDEVPRALKRYLDMNRLALQVVAPDGYFLSCSCTGLVSEEDFLGSIRRAAWQTDRRLQILQVSGAGADHPHQLHVPEGRYLKAVLCRVE